MPTLITAQSAIPDASTSDLVYTYNQLTGKSISKFSSRAAGEVQVSNAILAGIDRANHAGVPKGAQGTAAPLHRMPLDDSTATPEPTKEPEPMATTAKPAAKKPSKPAAKKPSKPAAKKAPTKKGSAPGRKPPAEASKAAPGARASVYNRVRLTAPDVLRRPQVGSQRSKVLAALQKRKSTTIDQLSEDVGFNARSFVHKLAGQGWCEVLPSKGAAE